MNNTTQLSNYPAQPTVSSSYGLGWEVMKKNFLELLLVLVIYIAVSIPVGIGDLDGDSLNASTIFAGLFSLVYGFFVLGPIGYGVAWVFLKVVRGDKFDVSDIFDGFKTNYLNIILANLLTGAIIGAGIIVFVVPGIIFACKLAFVPYLVMDKKLEVIEAVKTSWNMTRGHAWTIFFVGILALPIFILGVLCLIVGVLPAFIWIEGAFAAIYHTVDKDLNNHADEEPVIE